MDHRAPDKPREIFSILVLIRGDLRFSEQTPLPVRTYIKVCYREPLFPVFHRPCCSHIMKRETVLELEHALRTHPARARGSAHSPLHR
jgi:hypothetical protein